MIVESASDDAYCILRGGKESMVKLRRGWRFEQNDQRLDVGGLVIVNNSLTIDQTSAAQDRMT